MNDQIGPGSLLDTTDSLEAVGVFRGWKNFMFLIVLLCLLIVQGAFWLVNTGSVQLGRKAEAGDNVVVSAPQIKDPNAATTATVEPNKPAEAAATRSGLKKFLPFEMTFQCLSRTITFVNAILILSAAIYFLTVLFSLKVSLTGRLGGINHISRAFFLSLFMFVLLLPWQRVFGGVVIGAIYAPCELAKACSAEKADLFAKVLFYLRFSGYWFLIFLLLILSQMRTCRWTRAILRRLEVV
jgi:hypothetical protein